MVAPWMRVSTVVSSMEVRSTAERGLALSRSVVADYRITTVGALHEVFVEGIAGAEISMGVHARNLRVSAE